MAAARRHLRKLLLSAERGEELHVLPMPWLSHRKLASFAYVAEQYGYRYDGFAPGYSPSTPTHVFAFRRTADAQQRAVSAWAHHPDALRGGPLPGMRPGGSGLRPLPEVSHEVALILARIMVDVTGSQYRRKRIRFAVTAAVIGLVVILVRGASTAASMHGFLTGILPVIGGLSLLFLGAYVLGRRLSRRWAAKYRRMLDEAGIKWPVDRLG